MQRSKAIPRVQQLAITRKNVLKSMKTPAEQIERRKAGLRSNCASDFCLGVMRCKDEVLTRWARCVAREDAVCMGSLFGGGFVWEKREGANVWGEAAVPFLLRESDCVCETTDGGRREGETGLDLGGRRVCAVCGCAAAVW